MKSLKITILGLATAAIIGPAFAADLPPSGFELSDLRPSVEETSHGSWTGAYAGGNIGSKWNNGTTRYNSIPELNFSLINNQNSDASLTGGVQAGYNYQEDELIYGVEADISFASRNSSWRTSFATPYRARAEQSYLRSKSNLNWFGTLRGRLGYAINDELMLYLTGGAALGEVNVKSQGGVTTVPLHVGEPSWVSSKSFTRFGWTAGVGGEYAFTKNWSVKGEYLRVDLGTKSYILPNGSSLRQRTTSDVVRLGINYRFQ